MRQHLRVRISLVIPTYNAGTLLDDVLAGIGSVCRHIALRINDSGVTRCRVTNEVARVGEAL
jgi:hypothetical protein